MLSDHTAYTNPRLSVASAGKILAVPFFPPGELDGLVKILWSVNMKANSPRFASLETPT